MTRGEVEKTFCQFICFYYLIIIFLCPIYLVGVAHRVTLIIDKQIAYEKLLITVINIISLIIQ
jgi:hypothetical protein